jgi:hypothetical protein
MYPKPYTKCDCPRCRAKLNEEFNAIVVDVFSVEEAVDISKRIAAEFSSVQINKFRNAAT